jgi:hypothetical protein
MIALVITLALLIGKQGIPFEVFQTARKPISEAHNRLNRVL